MNRRKLLRLCAGALVTGVSGCAGSEWDRTDQTTSPIHAGPEIGLDLVAEGFSQPIAMEFPQATDFHYVAEKSGIIWLVDSDGIRQKPFLDITDKLLSEPTSWEQGLVGFTLHPEYPTTRNFYVRYSAPLKNSAPANFSHTFVLSEFRATSDLSAVNPDSERVLLELPQPGKFHQAGSIVFGPDGYLYVGVGDGGAPPEAAFRGYRDTGPGHAQDWYWFNRGGNGQDISSNLLGSILRLDVDRVGNGRPYAVPDSNPLVGKPGLDEQYAWGFRNPYRMSFDDNRLFVGDVGATSYEEINVVTKGGNYGWNVQEGSSCFNANTAMYNGLTDDVPNGLADSILETAPFSLLNLISNRFFWLDELPACPAATPDGDILREPEIVYSHEQARGGLGAAVIGGYTYRTSGIENLRGKYLFGDISGRVFASKADSIQPKPWTVEELEIRGTESGRLDDAILSFARDPDGDVYILTTGFTEGSGNVHRVSRP